MLPVPDSIGNSISVDSTGNIDSTAYPTEAHERQKVVEKVAKLAGDERKTRKKVVERHYDDCGDSVAGL
eukprot:2823431-Lingulodinium_polyedra.AAC.1